MSKMRPSMIKGSSPPYIDQTDSNQMQIDDYNSSNYPRHVYIQKFDINDTNQRLKFYPAINQRMNLNEFNLNSTGIPRINQNSRQIVYRSLGKYKLPNNNQFISDMHSSVPESPPGSVKRVHTGNKAINVTDAKSTYSIKSGPRDSNFGPWE